MKKLTHREFKEFVQGEEIISGGAWNARYIIKQGREDTFKLIKNNATKNDLFNFFSFKLNFNLNFKQIWRDLRTTWIQCHYSALISTHVNVF